MAAPRTFSVSLRTGITEELPVLTFEVNQTMTSSSLAKFDNVNYTPHFASDIDDLLSLVPNMAFMLKDLDTISSTIYHLQTRLQQSPNSRARFTFALGRLPFEILAEIFELCQLPAQQSTREPSLGFSLYEPPSGHRGALNIAQVCRDWRQVALATPKLWTRLEVIAEHPLTSSLVSDRLQLLERAKGLPTFLRVQLRQKWQPTGKETSLNGLPPRDSPRFPSVIALDVESASPRSRIASLSPCLSLFPNLRRLALIDCPIPPHDPALDDLLSRLSHLHIRFASTSDADAFFVDSATTHRLAHLASLFVEGPNSDAQPRACLPVDVLLRLCPRMEELCVVADDFTFSWPAASGAGSSPDGTSPTLEHLRLRTLIISVRICPGTELGWLERTSLPALQELSVTALDPERMRACIEPLTRRSGGSLRTLSLVHLDERHGQAFRRVGRELAAQAEASVGDSDSTRQKDASGRSVEVRRHWKDTGVYTGMMDRWYCAS